LPNCAESLAFEVVLA